MMSEYLQMLAIATISSWEYPGHFSQSYSNFFTQNETWKQTEISKEIKACSYLLF